MICAECCEACGKGLILDIIHCNAISEVRRIAGEDITLERTTVSRIVAREKEEAIEKLKREALEAGTTLSVIDGGNSGKGDR